MQKLKWMASTAWRNRPLRGDVQQRFCQETAEVLALRSKPVCFVYPVLILFTAAVIPQIDQQIRVSAACAVAAFAIAIVRTGIAGRFAEHCDPQPLWWPRLFGAGVYASAAVWTLFALSVMNTSRDSW